MCHDFGGRDFYGAEMRLMMCAFLRPQLKFDSFDELITAITDDVSFGIKALDTPALAALRDDPFFSQQSDAEPSAPAPAPTTDH